MVYGKFTNFELKIHALILSIGQYYQQIAAFSEASVAAGLGNVYK